MQRLLNQVPINNISLSARWDDGDMILSLKSCDMLVVSNIMCGIGLARGGRITSVTVYGWGLCDRLCPVLVCKGRYGLGGGGVLLFILGSKLGGVGPERGLRGGGRRWWCEEWARSG